ncbi:MAG TPA: STN domain-containing protein [Urbifossiella sp.]|nr:STN domain-containing protein [Urbifossiella sp.]
MTRFRLAAVLAASLAGLATAQPPADPLADARTRQLIQDQKAESEVKNALIEADRQARTNPKKAAQQLMAVQSSLDLSAAISGEARQRLTAQLQTRLAVIEGRPVANAGVRLDPAAPAVKATQKAAIDAMFAEVKEVREGIETVARLREQNKYAEADRAAAVLARKYPTNPAVLALGQKDNFANAVADSRAFTELQGQRLLAANKGLMESSLPAIRDVEFPKDWNLRAGKRSNEIKLTDKEKQLISALDKAVTISVKDQPLEYALQELSTAMNEKLLVDEKSLRDLDLDLKKLVSVNSRGLSARTALRQLLASNGLTFVVREEMIQIVTVERSRDLLTTRVYYLGDLIQALPLGGAPQTGTFLDFQQTQANAEKLITMIKASVDPLAWQGNGGSGTVTFHAPSMSIIVRASNEVHATLGSKLGR